MGSSSSRVEEDPMLVGKVGRGLMDRGGRGGKVKGSRSRGGSIAPGTISLHVRHGDKFIESPPMPDQVCNLWPRSLLVQC